MSGESGEQGRGGQLYVGEHRARHAPVRRVDRCLGARVGPDAEVDIGRADPGERVDQVRLYRAMNVLANECAEQPDKEHGDRPRAGVHVAHARA